MDRRSAIAAFVAILLLLLLWRSGIVSRIRRAGLFGLEDGGEETATLPGVLLPPSPNYRAPMRQTTGLICHCDATPYSAPIIVHEIERPAIPLPQYRNVPEQTSARAAKEMARAAAEQSTGFQW